MSPWMALICLANSTVAPAQTESEHSRFVAELEVHYGSNSAVMHFSSPESLRQPLRWQLALRTPQGRTLHQWHGSLILGADEVSLPVQWETIPAAAPDKPPPGHYTLRLRATAGGATQTQTWAAAPAAAALTARPAPALLAPAASPAPPVASPLPYTVVYGNLHSQTNHSDGGGALGHCTGAQDPQSAALGPADAYAFAERHGLDFLMTSEHNHMFDGSDGTNPDADPAAAHALYQQGLQGADDYQRMHPGFIALYDQEWGVINHGGHLNIFDSPALLGWERNAAGQLLADTYTARSDYASLYTLMRSQGWIGQFNHPGDDQFAIKGQPLAYTLDGDAVMVLCEVMNSNAFSQVSDESEARHSNYEAACNRLLAAGYHLAFSSDQDNHCANWGASYSNRTGILLPPNAPPSRENLLQALRARRVFATMDKTAQVLLTANEHLMGERFHNRGTLTIQVTYHSRSGHQLDAIALLHAIPGAGGEFSVVAHSATIELQPASGEHVYYARLTQDDGKLLWSAPIWVTQDP